MNDVNVEKKKRMKTFKQLISEQQTSEKMPILYGNSIIGHADNHHEAASIGLKHINKQSKWKNEPYSHDEVKNITSKGKFKYTPHSEPEDCWHIKVQN